LEGTEAVPMLPSAEVVGGIGAGKHSSAKSGRHKQHYMRRSWAQTLTRDTMRHNCHAVTLWDTPATQRGLHRYRSELTKFGLDNIYIHATNNSLLIAKHNIARKW